MSVDLAVLVPAYSRIVCAAIADDVGASDRTVLESLLHDIRLVSGLVESMRLAVARQLDVLADRTGAFDPEQTIAARGRTSRREAAATSRRARTTSQMPALGDALQQGEISLEHVDAVAQALAQLEPDERARLADQAEWITGCARRCMPHELLDLLRIRVRQLSADDGLQRFLRQQRATTLRMWTDPVTGMVKLFGEFDPELGAGIVQAVQTAADALAAGQLPTTCPTDERKHGHLRALAVANMIMGSSAVVQGAGMQGSGVQGSGVQESGVQESGVQGSGMQGSGMQGPGVRGSGVPLFVVTIDLRTIADGPHADSRVDVTGGVQLPIETLRRHACAANIVPVVLDGKGVALDVGRAKRFATPAQRHALRAMYRTCAVPGCRVAFDRTTIHHVRPWHPSGPTDLDNLLPVCDHHHHCAHEGGWVLQLDPADRTLTITLPDGTIMTNAPPFAASA